MSELYTRCGLCSKHHLQAARGQNLDLGFTMNQLNRGSVIHRGSTREQFGNTVTLGPRNSGFYENDLFCPWVVI